MSNHSAIPLFCLFAAYHATFCPASYTAAADTPTGSLEVRRTLRDIPVETEEIRIDETTGGPLRRYKVQTEHYEIICCNAGYGTDAGKQLEHLYSCWQTLFNQYLTEKNPAKHTAEEKENKKNNDQRFRVVIFCDQQDYRKNMAARFPAASRTNGFYAPPQPDKPSAIYCFPQEPSDKNVSPAARKVLFHEGTHQILTECFQKPKQKPADIPNNFWLVEGAALFMETLKIEDKQYRTGDLFDNRLYAAKIYHFERHFRLPIRQMTAMNRVQIQTSPDIVKIYDQSAALFYWLMFAENGRYRKPLFELIRHVHQGKSKPEALSTLTERSFSDLDKQYAEFLKTVPE
ncbi:MAG: hypothetical protein LBH00_12330 [Planctomycetaceae bacterium]|jgi:hypothetical protein|nr:hypothetical protein [Planctomycetaceae bacterium]